MGEVFHFGFMTYLLIAVILLVVIGFVSPPTFEAITDRLQDIARSLRGQIVAFAIL